MKRPTPKTARINRSHKTRAANQRASVVPKRRNAVRFLPSLVMIVLSFVVLRFNPGRSPAHQVRSREVLAYSTGMSVDGLLANSNAQRSQHGVSLFSLSPKLDQAAQSKAADMVARDYWAHNTPEGYEPWYFVAQAGYSYSTAGENLAYGFFTSSDAVTGWMNSAPHRDNLLSASFTEVGFGFANSADFAGHGEQTVVVAMYAKPTVAVTPTGQAVAPVPSAATRPISESTAQPAFATQPLTPAKSPLVPAANIPASTLMPTPSTSPAANTSDSPSSPQTLPASTSYAPKNSVASSPERKIRKIQFLAHGLAPWSITILVSSLVSLTIIWLIHRGRHMHKVFVVGERYVIHHLHIDMAVITAIMLGLSLLQNIGVVR